MEEDLLSSLPCRSNQASCLQTLLSPSFPTPSTIVIHGAPATGKSAVTCAVLNTVKVPHAIISSRECITVRHLLEQAATRSWLAMREVTGSSHAEPSQPRCDSVNSLSNNLEKLLRHTTKFVLVFDDIDRQREATPTLVPGLARLGSIVKNLTVIFIVSATTPRLLHLSGVPHVYFPPYSKEESIQILSLDLPIIFTRPVDESYDYGDEEEAEDRAWLWPKYCSVVWDSMGKAAARDLRSFKSLCNKLWRPFVQPIIDGQFGTRDFSKLLVSRKSVFQNESALSGTSMTGQQNIQSKTASKRPGLDDLPYYAKFVLCAAYLASYNPARQDSTYFMKSSDRKRRRRGGAKPGRPSKHRKIPRNLLSPSPFSLDRLLAIFHAILPKALASNRQILAQIATLTSLRLLSRPGSSNLDTLDPGSRFKVNCSWEYVASLGRSVGLEVRDYLVT